MNRVISATAMDKTFSVCMCACVRAACVCVYSCVCVCVRDERGFSPYTKRGKVKVEKCSSAYFIPFHVLAL